MTSARWTMLCAVVLLGCAPFGLLASCGNNDNKAGGGDDEQGDDATSDGTAPFDGSRGDVGSSDAAGNGDTGGGGAPGAPGCSSTCPPSVQCGHYVTCNGDTIACGTPCGKGEVCVGTVGNPPTQSCQLTTSTCMGQCGVIGTDSCGVPISCGGCPTGQACVNNACTPDTDAGVADSGCAPLTCTPDKNVSLCGTIGDGCGNTKQCSCPAGQQCFGGVCGTTPPECDPADAGVDGGPGAKCGSIANACGSGTVQCGGCEGTNKCVSGTCTSCTAPTCGSDTCGTVSNGCGASVSCGTCGGGQDCYDGGCCQPLTCAAAADAGLVKGCGPVALGCGQTATCSACGAGQTCYNEGCCTPLDCQEAMDAGLVTGCAPVPIGCGEQKSCAPCAAGTVCTNNTCVACVPKTCASFGNTGCGHADGCGNVLDCCADGTVCVSGGLCCPTGQSNQGGICCPTGDVNYQGSCCQPTCNENLPPGPQNSCGVIIFCGNN